MLFKWLKFFIFYIFVVLWICVAGELFLRVFDPQPILPRYVQAGDFGIRVNMSNQTYLHQTPEYQIEISINSKGIRANQDYSYKKPAGVKRIVVLGDSFGMGYGVSLEESFTEHMHRKLEELLGNKVEMINLSVSGYGTAEQLLMLQHEGVRYQPDVVLLTWHATDLNDNLRSELFTLEKNKLVRKNTTYLPGIKLRKFLLTFAVYRWLADNSHFYNWVRQFVSTNIKKLMVKMRFSNVFDQKANESKNNSYTTTLTNKLLDAIKFETESAGAELQILEIPIKKSRDEFHHSMPDIIRQRFKVVSPISHFMQFRGQLLYWEKSHGHFSPLGCKIVGEVLAKNLIKKKLITSTEYKGLKDK